MARFVHALVIGVKGGRRQHADGASQHRSFVRQNVTEHVIGHHHVELFRRSHQLHGRVVDVHVAQLYVRIVLGHLLHHFAPQLAGGQHVGLVDRTQLLATHARHVEADAGNPAYFAFAVWQGVVSLAFAALKLALAARRAEVDATGQLTDDQNVQARDDFRLQRRRVGQLRIENGRPQVGEQAQLRTDFQQPPFGAHVTLDLVPLRPAYGAQQYGVCLARTLKRLIGQRYAMPVDSRAADHVMLQLEAELELVVGQLQDLDRFGHDFRANAVTRENQNLLAHAFLYSFTRRGHVSLAEKFLTLCPQHYHVGAERAIGLDLVILPHFLTHGLLQMADGHTHRLRCTHALDPAVEFQVQALTAMAAHMQARLADLTLPLGSRVIAYMAGVAQHLDALQVRVEQRTARRHHIDESSHPTWLEHPAHLAQGQPQVAPMMSRVTAEDEIEARIGEGQLFGGTALGNDIAKATLAGSTGHYIEHRLRQVIGNHLGHQRRDVETDVTGAAAKVQHPRITPPCQLSL